MAYVFKKHQRDAYKFIKDKNKFALYMDMRMGKTPIIIKRFLNEKEPILLITPNCTIHDWTKNLTKYGIKNYSIPSGSGKEQLKQLINWPSTNFISELATWTIVSSESFVQTLPEVKDIIWGTLIIDECSFIRNPKNKVSKFILKNFSEINNIALMTGTPAPEKPLDYFNQLKLLGVTGIGKTYYEFRKYNFCRIGYDYALTEEKQKWLAKKISTVAFVASRTDYNIKDLKEQKIRYIETPKALISRYKEIKENFLVELEAQVKKTIFAPVAFTWLRQIAGGWLKHEDAIISIHNEKLNQLLFDVSNEFVNDQLVIWADFVHERNNIYEAFKRHNISSVIISSEQSKQERIKNRKLFNSGKARIIITSPKLTQFGVDFSNCDIELWYSCTLSSQNRSQASDRIFNLNKTRSLLELDYVVKNSIDELVLKKVKKKQSDEWAIKEAVKFLRRNF